MEPQILELLAKISDASSVAEIQKLISDNPDIAVNPIVSTMLNGKLASLAYKGGVNTEKMLERAEKNETEARESAASLAENWKLKKEMFEISAKLVDLFRKLHPGREGVVHVEINTKTGQITEDIPSETKNAFGILGEKVPAIRHDKGFKVRISKKRKEGEAEEKTA